MKKLRKHIQEYLRMRYLLGYKLIGATRVLNNFAAYLEKKNVSHIKTHHVLAFLQERGSPPYFRSVQAGIIRRFTFHLHTIDPLTEIPGPYLSPYSYHRKSPYIYSDAEVSKLLKTCGSVFPNSPFQAKTYYTLFGLIAVTGMRKSEALFLTNQCIDFEQGILTINETKFQKSRKIPIHKTTVKMLLEYAKNRNQHFNKKDFPYFFCNDRGTKLCVTSVNFTFRKMCAAGGIKKTEGKGPRITDLRHTFAVKTLKRCYSEELNPNEIIPALSIYLGHENPIHTYWYLTATPELLRLISNHLKNRGE
jgi:integrase